MTLQQIRYAIAIADTGSFNKAAESLYISQPSLSESMKDLEQELGITLFNRTARGITLTNDGMEFMIYARQLHSQYEVMAERFGQNGNIKKHFGVSTQHYSFVVKAFINTINQYNSTEFEFAVRESRTIDVIEDVFASRSEVGILYLSDFNQNAMKKIFSNKRLEYHILTTCGIYVYLWNGHPLAGKKSISHQDLEPYPCLSFEQGPDSSFYYAEEALSTNDYPKVIKANDRATMLNLMVGINGYTLCCGYICEELNGGDYAAIPYRDHEEQDLKVDLIYIIRRDIKLSKIAETFITELKNYLETADIR
ncbi:MAG: LysR family transcriptional regulator [Parasporobacterium sp.]|nr:LysR family transcriptional regulator [Parasporobacterium sp.]